ncbi:MAG: hypothetical protein K2I92_03760 [Muribaculaceae bacterium]|nr:hypothetical protein [Muribaculaceae bacterium]
MQIYVCLSTDFFVEEADEWRQEIWKMIRQRSDIAFRILTKRAHRIKEEAIDVGKYLAGDQMLNEKRPA